MTGPLSIEIGLNPNLTEVFGLLITWHGLFTALGIVAGVGLAVRLAATRRVSIDADTAYTLGMIIVFSGIVGARALYVIERYGDPGSGVESFLDIFRLNEGGISIYGAIIGGTIGGWAYALRNRLPGGVGADAAIFGMLIGLAVGRLGDIINGEHFAKASDLPWALVYTHPNSPGFSHSFELGATHPAVAYEALGDLAIIGVLALLWQRGPKSGVIFSLGLLLYSVMRFFVSFLRGDSKVLFLDLTTPQVVSLVVIAVAAGLLLFFLKRKEPGPAPTPAERQRASVPRAERRRRLRT